MWSRTDRAELREIPRSADGPPQMSPTLRFVWPFSSPSPSTRTDFETVRFALEARRLFIPKIMLLLSLCEFFFWFSFSAFADNQATSSLLPMPLLIDKLTPIAMDAISKEIFLLRKLKQQHSLPHGGWVFLTKL